MGNFINLKIWQKSHKLTLEIYSLTSKLPREELFGLTSQLRRASISVESNELKDSYELLNKQINSLIRYRRNYDEKTQ